jgi:hypothetical protein
MQALNIVFLGWLAWWVESSPDMERQVDVFELFTESLI